MKKDEEGSTPYVVSEGGETRHLNNNKCHNHIKILIPDRLKTDDFRFVKIIEKTKVPREKDFTKAANFAYDDPSLLRHLEKGYNYGVLGGQGGFVEIDADGGALVGELERQLPRTFTIKTPHGEREHKYIKTDEPHTEALFDTVVTTDGKRPTIGHLTGYGRQVVGPGCSIFDCPKCGAKGGVPGDNTEGKGRRIKCLKCGYEGDGEEKFYTIKDDCEIAEIPWVDLKKILAPYRAEKKKKSASKEETEYVFNNPKIQGIMDVIANPEDFVDEGDGKFRGFPLFGTHKKTPYFVIDTNKNAWKSWKDEKGGYIPQLIALQEGIIAPADHLEGDNFRKAMKIAYEKYGIERKGFEVERTGKGKDIFSLDDEGRRKINYETLINDVCNHFVFKVLNDTETIYAYDEGIYRRASIKVKEYLEEILGFQANKHIVSELLGHVQRKNYVERSVFNENKNYLPLQNGLLNLETFEVEPFDEEKIYNFQLPVEYDENASFEEYEKFFLEVLSKDDIPIMQEMFGYCLLPQYTAHKSFWWFGSGRNGKSQTGNLLTALLGQGNVARVPLEHLDGDHLYAAERLFGKLANIVAEPGTTKVLSTEQFKACTGGDPIQSDIKYAQDVLNFTNFAKFVVYANKVPKIGDDTDSFWLRVIALSFNNQFVGEKDKKNIAQKIIEKAGLSGLLNWALVGLKRLRDNQWEFSDSIEQKNAKALMRRQSQPVVTFLEEWITKDATGTVQKETLFNIFKTYCDCCNIVRLEQHLFTRDLKKYAYVGEKKISVKIEGKAVRRWAWTGLSYNENVIVEWKDDDGKKQACTIEEFLKCPTCPTCPTFSLNSKTMGETEEIEENKGSIPLIAKSLGNTLDNMDNMDTSKNNTQNDTNNEINNTEKPTRNVNIDLVCECGEPFENKEFLNEHRKNCLVFHKKQTMEAKTQ